MIVFVYAVLVFLAIRFSVTLFNFLSNPKLGYYGKHFTDKVSIIVLLNKANEDASGLIASIKNQDYKDIEIIVKPYGEELKKVVSMAAGSYLLFLDADTSIHKGLINNLICRSKLFNLSLLSLIPNCRPKGLLEWCVYPLNDFVLLNLLPVRLVRLINQPFAIVNTACMFYLANAYKRHNGQERFEGKTEVLLANRFVYQQKTVDLTHLSKQLLLSFGNNVPATLIYIILVIAGPIIMICNFNPVLIALPAGLIFLTRIMISFLTFQNPVINILMHPVQMLMLFILLIRGLSDKILTLVKYKMS